MSNERQSVSDTVRWLSFPRQAYPNLYLNEQRIGQRFRGYLGSISEFNESVERSSGANASAAALFLQAGIQRGRGGATEIAYDLADPLAQVLVLRAYLATVGELHTDARSAPVTDFVLARGRGGLIRPHDVADSPLWQEGGISPDVVTEIAAEQASRLEGQTGDDGRVHPNKGSASLGYVRTLVHSSARSGSCRRAGSRRYDAGGRAYEFMRSENRSGRARPARWSELHSPLSQWRSR
jgi:hypothetical protein